MTRQPAQPRPFLEDRAQATYADARVVVLPVSYEGTVSYARGTARCPAAILEASTQLELHDEQSGTDPYRCGVWTAETLVGGPDPPEQVVERVAQRCAELLDAGKWPVMLGGEHSITVGAVRAAAARFEGLRIVQLDAHADLRESYQGSPFSHACAMSRCIELVPVHAIGIRSYSAEEAERIRSGIPDYRILHAWEMQGADWIDRALDDLSGRPVYLSIDLDYFDPSIIPSTGTPEPGGPAWWPTLALLARLFQATNVVACDVVELAPAPGLHHPDYTAARLVYKLIGFWGKATKR
jgi:agmatinase